jgi:hypothetical protein
MAALVVVLLLASACGLLLLRSRANAWARAERAAGRQTFWTKNIGLAAPKVASSRAARLSARVGAPLALALLLGSFAIGGSLGWVLLIAAAAVVLGLYAVRLRA